MKSVDQKRKIIEQTRMLVDLFLETKKSDNELSKITGLTSSTVGRRLTNIEVFKEALGNDYFEIFDQVQQLRQENLKNAKRKGGKTTTEKTTYLKDNKGKFLGGKPVNFDLLFTKEKNKIRFLTHVVLYFRLHLETAAKIFDENSEVFKRNLFNNNPELTCSITYLFNDDTKNQDIARNEFYAYYNELLNATKEKNYDKRKELIDKVTDKKYRDLKQTREKGNKLDNDIILTVLEHQLKYGISTTRVCENFIHRTSYVSRVNEILETGNYPELKQGFENLTDYYREYFFKVKPKEDRLYNGRR